MSARRLTLKQWRERNGLSQEKLAEQLVIDGRKVRQSDIAKWEGGVIPRPPALKAIREFTGGKVLADSWIE